MSQHLFYAEGVVLAFQIDMLPVALLICNLSDETVNAVKNWLTGSGIAIERIKSSAAMGWLQINATVAEAENLLKTKYHVFEHTETGTLHVACDSYSLPGLIKEHVDFVTPSVHFDAKIKRDAGAETETIGKRDDGGSEHWTRPGTGRGMGWNRGHGWWRGPWKGRPVNPYNQQMNNLANCDMYALCVISIVQSILIDNVGTSHQTVLEHSTNFALAIRGKSQTRRTHMASSSIPRKHISQVTWTCFSEISPHPKLEPDQYLTPSTEGSINSNTRTSRSTGSLTWIWNTP